MELTENIFRVKQLMGLVTESTEKIPNNNGQFDIIVPKKIIDKKENKEGAGGYQAPAFQMEPDHVTFKKNYNEEELNERCWKGYTQKGMKTMFGKRYPNCVKKKK